MAWFLFFQASSFRFSPFYSPDQEGLFYTFLMNIWNVIRADETLLLLTFFGLFVVFLGWFFTPFLCRAAITYKIAKAKSVGNMRGGIRQAFLHFFVLLEITALKHVFEPISFFTQFSFISRHVPGLDPLTIPIFLFFSGIGLLGLFLMIYTNQAIMLSEKGFTQAIIKSSTMVIRNLFRTLQILILFLLVEMRVFVNILIVLALPIIFASTTGMFAFFFSDQIGLFLTVTLLITILGLVSYISGILFVFSEAIWTVAFIEHQKNEAEKDEIQVPEEGVLKNPYS
jgi:hypothetical protein